MAPQKLAVLVGCRYKTKQLMGTFNDVSYMCNLLQDKFRFRRENIQILTDNENANSSQVPKRQNILNALDNLTGKANSGDSILFYFSGHGRLLKKKDPIGNAIVPTDYNLITESEFRDIANSVHEKAFFTVVADSCHSGGLIDKEKEQTGINLRSIFHRSQECIGQGMSDEDLIAQLSEMSGLDSRDIGAHLIKLYNKDISPVFYNTVTAEPIRVLADNGILLSACQKQETAWERREDTPKVSVFTDALRSVLLNHPGKISNKDLIKATRKLVSDQGYKQTPSLYCSDNNANAPFLQYEG